MLRILIVLFAGLIQPTMAAAQSMTSARLSGSAITDSGQAITGALVQLREVRTGFTWPQEAGSEGRFAFTFVTPGEYELFVEQIGYRPARVVNIEVAPGSDVRLWVRLQAATPPVLAVDTINYGGEPVGRAPAAEQAVRGFAIDRVPFERRQLADEAGLASNLGAGLGAEGLSSRGTIFAVNGIRHDVARHPYLSGGDLLTLPVPHTAVSRLDAVTAPIDGEWTDFAGAVLNATTRTGTGYFTVEGFGDFSGSPLATSRVFDPGTPFAGSWRGGALLSAPILPDTTYLFVAVEGQRVEQPMPPAWIGGAGDATITATGAAAGADLSGLVAPRRASDDLLNGLMRLDWQLGPRHRAVVLAAAGLSRQSEPYTGTAGIPSPGTRYETRDFIADGSVTSQLGSKWANELRFGFERSERDFGAGALPGTYLATGQRFGTDPAFPADVRRTAARLEEVLHLKKGSHLLKLGLTGSIATYRQGFTFGQQGIYWFEDPSEFALGRGAFLGTSSTGRTAAFSVPRFGGTLQDQWSVTPGLQLISAVRYDREFLPENEIPLNRDWLIATAINNQQIPHAIGGWSSRLGFVWRIGESAWLLRGGAGVYRDLVDPAVLSEVSIESGGSIVRRGIGTITGWPGQPSATDAPEVGARLSLLGPNYEPPRSLKVTLGIVRRIGAGTISLSGNYRHTDYLIRRHDLNRFPAPVASDQYGRPLYGSMAKQGGLLAAVPGTGRRFDGFEMVSALDPDGTSNYAGATLELLQSVGRFVKLRAAYTFSRVSDNWLSGAGGGPYAQLTPFPDSLDGRDWSNGRSDFDVPHQVTVGAEFWPLGRWISVAARYQLRSGRAFTPGFRPGVDANGDGSATNDPAFVDAGLTGMDVVLGQWSCLASQIAQFAERNSCREPLTHSLDVRVGIGPTRVAGIGVELWVEGLNLTDQAFGVRDHALHLVDGAAPLVADPITGEVTVPLLVNQNFGRPLAYRSAGRFLRVSLRVGY